MSSAPPQLAALRHLLAARFPSASRTANSRLATGLSSIDDPTAGGLPTAALTELVCAAPSCGSHLLLGHLLAVTRAQRQRVALVDPTESFDPESHPAEHLAHLIWARGGSTATALSVTDLLARDANLGLVLLDLRHAPLSELRRVPATLWYRLQHAVEDTELALLIFTPRPLVPSAKLRLELSQSLTLPSLETDRPHLPPQLNPTFLRHRLTTAQTA